MIFGSARDFNTITGISRELFSDVVEQEVLYYKFSLQESEANIYGESTKKIFYVPSKLNCFIVRGDQVITDDEFGPDLRREASFAFIREDLSDIQVVPEVGDIVEWNRDYYEVDVVRENQLFFGRDASYNLTSYGNQFAKSVSIIVDCHLTRADKLNISEVR